MTEAGPATTNDAPAHVRFQGVRAAAGILLAALFGLCAYWTLRLGWADRLFQAGSPGSVELARLLAPGKAAYFASDPADRPALRRAVSLNPRLSSAWIELGLLAEADGDLAEAERCLLEAAAVDATYHPPWSLANFYFRHGQGEKFWPWARLAAERAYYPQPPLFRLYWQLSRDPSVILARGIPDRPDILAQYLYFLAADRRLAEAAPVAQRLLPVSRRQDLAVLIHYCDQLIAGGRVAEAVAVWNSLSGRGLIPYGALEPRAGRSVTNGDFAHPPLNSAFDWRLHPVQGVPATRSDSPAGLRFTFSGRQPEHCVLLEQVLPAEPGQSYRLAYHWRSSGIPAASGLRWYVADLAAGKELAAAPMGNGLEDWRPGWVDFIAPENASGVRLLLEYRRAPGTTRIEGSIWLRGISTSLQWRRSRL